MLRKAILAITMATAVGTGASLAAGCGGGTASVSPAADGAPDRAEGAPGGGDGAASGADGGDGGPEVDGSGEAGPASGNEAGNDFAIPRGKAGKVDLLFDIDNSASMGDKQQYLSRAIPDLVRRLVSPNCIDPAGHPTGASADTSGRCTTGIPEFTPVRDMHIGIVSSSLGPRLGDACPTTGQFSKQPLANGSIDRHNDDQGHLLDRGSDPANLSNYTETPVAAAATQGFLDWAPTASAGPLAIKDPQALDSDFQAMVTGVHFFGCGIESQLESWYRFLVQPDPYASLTTSTAGIAQLQGVDGVLLAQRADFLRPDSLVAIVVVSDENDSEVDVRSFGGTGWHFMNTSFKPPRGTSACATQPNDAACTSCGFGKTPNDPACMMGPYSAPTDWGFDLNLRHVHEKEKYGVSVQFPIQRYVVGLSSPTVPDRNGEYPTGATDYQGLAVANRLCTNPLFAATLPAPPTGVDPAQWQPTAAELCNLPPGGRDASLIYYSHIGGVPHQLLQIDPTNPASPQKDKLTAADWTLILGRDPVNYDYSGIDPHMVESYKPRTAATVPAGGFPVADPSAPEGADPISGREWITDSTMAQHNGLNVDREYACVFKLATPRPCDAAATAADPTLADSCDCGPPLQGTGSFTHAQVPAICNDATPTLQEYAKAYPTIRELLLAKLLGEVPGANEGVVSSLCPIHTVEASAGDPLYGYRPAVSAIVSRLQKGLF